MWTGWEDDHQAKCSAVQCIAGERGGIRLREWATIRARSNNYMTGNNTINYHYVYRSVRIKRQFPYAASQPAIHSLRSDPFRPVQPLMCSSPFLCFPMRKCSDNLIFINRDVVQVQLLNAIFLVHRFAIAMERMGRETSLRQESVWKCLTEWDAPLPLPACLPRPSEPNRNTWENVAARYWLWRGANCVSVVQLCSHRSSLIFS